MTLPWPLTMLAFVAAALVLSFGPYALLRRILPVEDETERLAGSVLIRIGGLHALILALVFADAQVSLVDLRKGVAEEATALNDIFYDLERYGTPRADQARTHVVAYTRAVVEEDWPLLRDQRLSDAAWRSWRSLYDEVLDLEPTSRRQEDLRRLLIDRVGAIADFREERRNGAGRSLSGVFWGVAGVGFLLVALPYFVFRPTPANLFLMSAFGVFNGLVMFMILATNDPFGQPVAIEPEPFRVLLSVDMARE